MVHAGMLSRPLRDPAGREDLDKVLGEGGPGWDLYEGDTSLASKQQPSSGFC